MFARRFVPVQPISLWQRLIGEESEPQRVAKILNADHLRIMEVYRISFERLYPNAISHFFQVHNLQGYTSLEAPNFDILSPEKLKPFLPQATDYIYESLVPRATVGELKKNPTPGFARFQWAADVRREIGIERETMNTVELKLGAGAEADLIRTDTYFPGWTASIDGKQIPVERAEPFFSKLRIPAGAQNLTLRYTPIYLHLGIILALGSIAVTTVLSLMLARNSKAQSLAS